MATEWVLNEYCSTIAAPGFLSNNGATKSSGPKLTQVAYGHKRLILGPPLPPIS
jgi:hypothetical protein